MRGKPFQPGNTFGRGRPPGSRNKVASPLQQTLEERGEILTKKCAHMALHENPTAMKLCMDRLLPALRQRVLQFKLPPTKTLAELAAASEAVFKGVTRGLLTPAEGQALMYMLEGRRRIIETEELEARLRALEEGSNKI